jgi:hypothetical protein
MESTFNNNNKKYQNNEQDRRLQCLEEHYSNFNSEMGEVKSDVKWLKWWIQITAGASITGLIMGVINFITGK